MSSAAAPNGSSVITAVGDARPPFDALVFATQNSPPPASDMRPYSASETGNDIHERGSATIGSRDRSPSSRVVNRG
jgi:hypothetical protein